MMYYWLLWVVSACTAMAMATTGCPDGCFCLLTRITCEANSVTEIPSNGGISRTVLDLKSNRLSSSVLSSTDFTQFVNLTQLILSDCGIETIQPYTFAGLTQLRHLDLSLNRLRSIDVNAFSGLSLSYLFLGDNPSISLPPSGFTDMSTEIIDLKSCKLTEITSSFVTPLMPGLRKLFVNGNEIKRFSSDMYDIFNALESLRIQDNPLVCDCKSHWLKHFYDQHTEKMTQDGQAEPRCNEPDALSGTFFNMLSPSDFLCEKPSLDTQITITKEKTILKCYSRADPPPKVIWYRPDGAVEETSPTNSETTRALIEVASSDRGLYRCVASNQAGNVSQSVNLTLPTVSPCSDLTVTTNKEIVLPNNTPSEAPQEADVFKTKYFTIIDIIIAVFGTFGGTLIVTALVLHFCVYGKRKSSSQYSTPPQSEYSGGSIKNEVYAANSQQLQIRSMQHMQSMQNRPLPNEPCHKSYDENHYMSTQLGDNEDFARFGQHNAGALVSPHSPAPCHQCHAMTSHHRHSQPL